MTLRRGFKAEANSYARMFRTELRLDAWEPLSPWLLAEHLEVPVIKLSTLQSRAKAEVQYLLRNGRDYFSAVTVFSGWRRAILHNDGNAPTRQAADIAHELAHIVLGHAPQAISRGVESQSATLQAEAEANWLGPALLVSEEAALQIARSGRPLLEAAAEYGVSVSLLRMRLNVTGASRRQSV